MLRRALRRSSTFLLLAGAGVALAAAFLLSGGRALAGSNCWYGQIFLNGRPVLSAPNPAHVGDTITSTGGAWSVCGGEAFTGYYKEWLRDGVAISGPDWVEGPPSSFTYTIQAADVGHEIRSAVSACDVDFGCYLPYAQSSNAVIPGYAPPPPPPPGPPEAVHGYVEDANGAAVAGAAVALYRDIDTDGSGTQSAPLDRATTDQRGFYSLHVAYDPGLVDGEGWANFAVEGTSADVPYYAAAARKWDGLGDWLTPDEAAQVDSQDPTYPVLPDDVVLVPQAGASIARGGGPDVQSPECWLATDTTTLVATQIAPTVIGELHVARDATGRFTYAEGDRADSYISVGTTLGGIGWLVDLALFKHISRADNSSVSESNPSDDWAHRLLSNFVYAKYRHQRIGVFGRVCSTWYTIEPKEWWGGIWPGADESRYLHQCLTTYRRYMNFFGPDSSFQRRRYKLRTWTGAATVDLGSGGVALAARSGASSHVDYHYHFGSGSSHYLCGNDAQPSRSTRVLAGG